MSRSFSGGSSRSAGTRASMASHMLAVNGAAQSLGSSWGACIRCGTRAGIGRYPSVEKPAQALDLLLQLRDLVRVRWTAATRGLWCRCRWCQVLRRRNRFRCPWGQFRFRGLYGRPCRPRSCQLVDSDPGDKHPENSTEDEAVKGHGSVGNVNRSSLVRQAAQPAAGRGAQLGVEHPKVHPASPELPRVRRRAFPEPPRRRLPLRGQTHKSHSTCSNSADGPLV